MSFPQRPYRGSRVSSFYPIKSLPPLSSLDSAFQLQEYISLLIRLDVHDVDAIVALPGKLATKDHDETPDSPEHDAKKSDDPDRKSDISVDKACWIYEQLRRLAQDLSHPLITMLQQECTRSSCPQMKAGEWLYLCVAHGNDGAMEQCCAIDYILHTVDSATALLNSPRAFPSRLSIPQTSHRHFSSLARRLGRIFAHAYFHHREAFEQAEAESSLYARFLKLTSQFDLVPPEFLVIPESAIHHDDKHHAEEVEPPRLFSAAVHPKPNIQGDTTTARDVSPVAEIHPRAVNTANQLGTDSPRKLGRSRTDTMVFSEAFSVAEELSKSEDGGSSLGNSPIAETQPLVSTESWSNFQTRTEDLDDEDIGDAQSDLTLSGPLSPPVEALSLISLEDTTTAPIPNEATPSLPEQSLQKPLSDAPVTESSPEEPVPVAFVPKVTASPTFKVEEPASGEASVVTSEVPTESTQTLPGTEKSVAGSLSKDVVSVSESSSEGPRAMKAETELPPPQPLLVLNEPPPSEPIPPESESDITDEVSELDGDKVKEGGKDVDHGPAAS